MTHRLGTLLLLCLLAAIAAGCTHAAGKVPTSFPVQTFVAPDKDDVFPDDNATDDAPATGADSEGE